MAVWVRRDFRTGHDGLRLYANGVTRWLPVSSEAASVEHPDLGVDGAGHTVVVYSRCAPQRDANGEQDCDLYEYRIGARREHRIPSLSTAGWAETMPAISGDRIALARTRNSSVRPHQALYIFNRRTRKLTRLPALRQGLIYESGDTYVGAGALDLDLSGSRAVVRWSYTEPDCTDQIGDYVTNESLWLLTAHSKRELGSEPPCRHTYWNEWLSPTLSPSSLIYVEQRFKAPSSAESRLVRYDLASGSTEVAPGYEDTYSVAGTQDLTFSLRKPDSSTVEQVVQSTPEFASP